MRNHSVEKIGGTSMSQLSDVVNKVVFGAGQAQKGGRILVVSAFSGVTNALLEDKKSGAPGIFALFAAGRGGLEGGWREALENLRAVLMELNARHLGAPVDRDCADDFVNARLDDTVACLENVERLCAHGHFRLDSQLDSVREMLVSIGEAHSALVLSLALKREGLNARFVDLTGWGDQRPLSLDERIRDGFDEVDLDRDLPVVTGYARSHEGLLAEYGRGYSEVTFSRLAVLTGAREGVIHKEFHLSSADPRIVGAEKVRTIGQTNYDVADQLANLGMEAIHPRAARGMRQARIPLRVRNTFEPGDNGTLIRGDFVSDTPRVEIICGLKGVVALEVLEQDMVGVKGYDAAILESLTRHNVRIVSKASNANTITHHLEASPKSVKRVIRDLEARYPNAVITAHKVAVVSVIGSDLNLPGIIARGAGALYDAGINVLALQQVSRRVDVQFIVDDAEYEPAIRALHAELIEDKKVQLKSVA